MVNYIEQFKNAIKSAGLIAPDFIEADGKIHRFSSNGKPGSKAGWYVCHSDSIPAGVFGDWRSDYSETWRADIGRSLSKDEEAEYRFRVNQIKQNRDAELLARQSQAKIKATEMLAKCRGALVTHPYLVKKGIRPHNLKQDGDNLILPAFKDGEIQSLQIIYPDGNKRFLPGGKVSGCFSFIGKLESAETLCIVEGYATGASIYEATQYPVIVAFNAGNLLAVACSVRDENPSLKLIVCADDDYQTDGNIGVTKATEAALAVGGLLAIPSFKSDRADKATDFNDMHQACGLEAVKQAIESATTPNMLDSTASRGDNAKPIKQAKSKMSACSFVDLLSVDLPIPPPIIEPFLFEADLAMYHGWRGTGKTWFSLSLAYAIASGGSFLGYRCNNPKKVLYLDGEMVGGRLKKRLAQIAKGFIGTDITADPLTNLSIVTRDMQDPLVDWADIGTEAGRADINSLTNQCGAQVVILDNLPAWQRTGGKENDADSWNQIAGWLLGLRSQGIAVVLIHHQGKNGQQRGTSKKEDILDTVIGLNRPEDYDSTDGLRVGLAFEKSRNLDGDEIPSIEVSLKVEDNAATFDVLQSKTDPISRAHKLIDSGASRSEIQNELNLSRFALIRLQERAEKVGRGFKLPDARKGQGATPFSVNDYSSIKNGGE